MPWAEYRHIFCYSSSQLWRLNKVVDDSSKCWRQWKLFARERCF